VYQYKKYIPIPNLLLLMLFKHLIRRRETIINAPTVLQKSNRSTDVEFELTAKLR